MSELAINQKMEPKKSITILAVDDDHQVLEFIRQFLEGEGYAMELAHDGEDCLRKLKICQPELILLDIKMPKMSGMEVLKKIKADKLCEDIAVVMVTSAKDTVSRSCEEMKWILKNRYATSFVGCCSRATRT